MLDRFICMGCISKDVVIYNDCLYLYDGIIELWFSYYLIVMFGFILI